MLELNNNENATFENVWSVAQAVLKSKCIALKK